MTCKCVCVFVYVCESVLFGGGGAHMSQSIQDSRVNAVDKAIGLTWQSIVLISPVSLSIYLAVEMRDNSAGCTHIHTHTHTTPAPAVCSDLQLYQM